MKKEYVLNPYLPEWEYIPDGEPHVFGNRVYLYGSHDRAHGEKYCMNDYVCYSADIHDLKDWRYEGVIYRSRQDPRAQTEVHQMWAPDVARGKDGRYYLYYCLDDSIRSIGVAVCDTPAGKYEFYGLVQDGKGGLIGEREAMAIRSKSLNYNYLTISDATASTLKTIMIGVCPLAYLGIGIIVIVARRRKQNETV